MASSSAKDDPWYWSVARVVEELCTEKRSWKLLGDRPMPEDDRKKLADQITRHEIDGVSLLADLDNPDFFVDLKIKKSKHKGIIRHAVSQLRRRSRRYAQHKKEEEEQEVPEDSDVSMEDGEDGEDDEQDLQARKRKLDAERMSQASEDMYDTREAPTQSVSTATVAHGQVLPTSETAPLPFSREENSVRNAQVVRSSKSPGHKKRRVVPTTLVSTVDRDAWPTPTEAAPFLNAPIQETRSNITDDPSDLNDSAPPMALYLGEEAFSRFDIVDTESAGSASENEATFEISRRVLPGRRRQVHRFYKRRFVPRRATSRYRPAKPDAVPNANNPEHDDVLPLLGDSGSDEEYDSDTWAEIEAEKEERLARQDTGLTEAQVIETWDKVIATFKESWEQSKLPKLQQKAHFQWSKARRAGLKQAIGRVQHDVDDWQTRLADQRSHFVKKGRDWRDAAEMESTMETVEHTAHDLHTALWMLNLLKSPVEPPKPPRAARQPRKKPQKRRVAPAEDEEVLTDESEFDDFIVSDDEALAEATPENRGAGESGGNKSAADGTDLNAGSKDPDIEMDDGADDDVLDLTQMDVSQESPSPTAGPPDQPQIIDLTTPTRKSAESKRFISSTPRPYKLVLKAQSRDRQYHWDLAKKHIGRMSPTYRKLLFTVPEWREGSMDVWKDWVLPGLNGTWKGPPFSDSSDQQIYMARVMVHLLDLFTTGKDKPLTDYKAILPERKKTIEAMRRPFRDLIEFLAQLSKCGSKEATANASPSVSEGVSRTLDLPRQSEDMDIEEDDEEQSLSADDTPTKRKPVRRDQAAQDLRESDRRRLEEQEARRQLLRAKLADPGSGAASQKSRLIVNETKEDDQGFIYIPDNVAGRIKNHQIEGIRFMWNQIVTKSKTRQGCLLAHTMGLGKTMQIITLLLTIAEAAFSEDDTISSQIPDDMKGQKTLVLSPAGLVNNWMDEFLIWAPKGHRLGNFYKIDAEMTDISVRQNTVNIWAEHGGVLMVGYDLFKMLIKTESMCRRLMEAPNIVIADEAHMMKNPTSKVHLATQGFRTPVRIALTGSPLANNVKEYHSMINWVAPHYLSDMSEFKLDYALPIEEGLAVDSTPAQRRKAITKLSALKQTVAPKVHRATIAVLKNDIPPKAEFVISVPLTLLQEKVYKAYITYQKQSAAQRSETTKIFGALSVLNILCNHPAAFRSRLAKEKQPRKKPSNEEDTAASTALPPQLVSDLLRMMPERGIEDPTLSNKIVLFNKLLDESIAQGDRVLVFSHSISTLNFLEKVLRKDRRQFLRLDGDTPIAKRQGMVKDFNNAPYDVFLISTTAGGLGLNITGANRVVIMDFKFNPQHEQQAVGRAYRLGQQKPVFVYRFICGGTFEEKMQDRQIFKMQLSSRVVDHRNPIPKAQRLGELFELPNEPKQENLGASKGKDAVLDAVLASQEHVSVIRKIVTSDSFFEEADGDNILTVEEQREAQRLIDLHHARRGYAPSGQANGATLAHSTQPFAAPVPQSSSGVNAFDFVVPSQAAAQQAHAMQPSGQQARPMQSPAYQPRFTRIPAQLPRAMQSPAQQAPPMHSPAPQAWDLETARPLAVANNAQPHATASPAPSNGPLAPVPGASTQIRHNPRKYTWW